VSTFASGAWAWKPLPHRLQADLQKGRSQREPLLIWILLVGDQRNRHGVWPLTTRLQCRPRRITSSPILAGLELDEFYKLLLLRTNDDDSSGVLRCELGRRPIIDDHHQHALIVSMRRRCRYGLCDSLGEHGHRRTGSFRLWLSELASGRCLALDFPSCRSMRLHFETQDMFMAVSFEIFS
jgi:hypothetical protein